MHWIYLIHEFHYLSWITEINELFHDILIYWDAPYFNSLPLYIHKHYIYMPIEIIVIIIIAITIIIIKYIKT